MALGVLEIIYIVLVITAVIIQALLYKSKNKSQNNIFIINMLFALLLTYMVFTALPTNYMGQRILVIVLGALSLLAVLVKLKSEKLFLASKVMLTVSVFGNLVQLFL